MKRFDADSVWTIEDGLLSDGGRWLKDAKDTIATLYHEFFPAITMEGKAGVANVTRNRVNDARWPSTYCEVVQQGPVRESWKTKQHKDLKPEERIYYPRKHRCQFSWYCDGLRDIIWANKEKSGLTIEGNARA